MSDETNRPVGVCETCGRTKHIHQKRDGKPICAACLRRARTASAALNKGTKGKAMQCAAATIAIEKWVTLTSDPELKEGLERLLEKISVLNVVGSGGVTAAEYAQLEESVGASNPFASVTDPSHEPLEVEFDANDEPADENAPVTDPYAVEDQDALNPRRAAECAAKPQASTGPGAEPGESPEIKQEIASPPADKSEGAALVALSDESREELIDDFDFTPSEVNKVRVRPGLGAKAEMAEALRQLGEQHE